MQRREEIMDPAQELADPVTGILGSDYRKKACKSCKPKHKYVDA